ncbi:hypothetical protein CR51_10225 [Caballeronia megalochromosomata]|nr:hypothetical protein CR51_10225 [Caballeronia megalochromosomata]
MHEFTVSDTEYSNYLFLNQLMLYTNVSDYCFNAYLFARNLMRSSAGGSLDRVVGMMGRRIGFSLDDSYRLFAVAIFLGYLEPDHRFKLDVDEPVFLLGRDKNKSAKSIRGHAL